MGTSPSRVRKLIEDKSLLAERRDGVLKVPASFVKNGEALPEIRGTVILLEDSGFTTEEALTWLLADEASLGTAPIDALLAGRKAEVRRVAQALA
jgi:hypothetical protein